MKPSASCRVSAVPTYFWSASSVTIVENWAESATTEKPQIRPMIRTKTVGSPKNSPIERAQAPEIGHHQSRRLGTAPAIAQHPPDPAADSSDPDHRERGEGRCRARGLAPFLERGPEEDHEPGPHRVQLPHVAEVTERGQPDAAVGEGPAGLARIEGSAGEGKGAVGDPGGDQPAGNREGGGDDDHQTPVEAAEAVDEVRQRRANGQRPDKDPQRGAATFAVPGRHHLQRRRVDLGQRRTGEEAQRQRGQRPVGEDDQAVRERSGERPRENHTLRAEDVGEVEQRRAECTDDETQLYRDRQPGGAAAAQIPVQPQLRDHG